MSYFLLENFKAGLDVRKSILTAPAGTLTKLVNAAITPGGEIQKRKAFVKVATLTGTFGLAAIGKTLVTFTRNTTPANPGIKDPVTNASPTDVTLEYHRLPNESPSALLTDFDVFDGKLYVVLSDQSPKPPASTQSGAVLPDGIPDGTTYLQTSNGQMYVWRQNYWADWAAASRVGQLPARGYSGSYYHNLTEGKWYMISGGEWVPQTAAPSNAGSFPSGAGLPSNQIEGATRYNYNDKKNYITKNQLWVVYTPDKTVATLPAGIKDGTLFKLTTDNNYYEWKTSAWSIWRGAPPVSTIQGTALPTTAADTDVFYNTADKTTWTRKNGNWVKWTLSPRLSNPHYYLDDREKVNDQFVQKVDLTWEWTTKVNPNKGTYQETEGSGMGLYVRAYKSKMYTVGDRYLRFSAVDNAFLWEAATDPNDTSRTGAGFINVSLQEGGSSQLKGVEIYYDKLALLSELSTQIWAVVADPKQNSLGQVLRQTGTESPWSVQQYGSGDILFLHSSGIRSLKARDISNSAAVSDIGSPIDEIIRTIPRFDRTLCRAVLEPIVGRVWYCFRRNIYLLSFFPGPNITAWSEFTTDFDIDYVVTAGDRLFIRSGDNLYLYGGVSGNEYDTSAVEIRLPFHDGSKPGHMKQYQAIDATVWGSWDIKVAYNFDQPEAEELVARISAPTWNKGRHELEGYASHMSMRFYNNTAEKAQIANCAIHYAMSTDAD